MQWYIICMPIVSKTGESLVTISLLVHFFVSLCHLWYHHFGFDCSCNYAHINETMQLCYNNMNAMLNVLCAPSWRSISITAILYYMDDKIRACWLLIMSRKFSYTRPKYFERNHRKKYHVSEYISMHVCTCNTCTVQLMYIVVQFHARIYSCTGINISTIVITTNAVVSIHFKTWMDRTKYLYIWQDSAMQNLQSTIYINPAYGC